MITPASIRNNNPGAMYPGKSAKKFGSTSFEVLKSKDGVHKIATFPTPIHGAAAQFDLLSRSYCGMPLEKAITKWCGAFYVSTYLKVLEENGGIKRTDILTKERLADPEIGIPLAQAMALQEAGRNYPLDDDGWKQAHAMAFGGESVAPGFAPDNDVPTPKRETRIAEAVNTAIKYGAPTVATTGGAVAVTTQQASTPAPEKPKLTAKETLAKAQETKALVEQAKDLGTYGVQLGKWAFGDGLLVMGLLAIAAVALAFPKIREKLT